MKKNTATIQSIFTGNPDVKEFFFTSDEQAFHLEKDAKNHALDLKRREKDATVTLITKDEAFAKDSAAAGSNDQGNDQGNTGAPAAKTAQELLNEAQAAHDAAVQGGDATEISNTKKALIVAKTRVTKEANKTV